jgi:hypothetical protein
MRHYEKVYGANVNSCDQAFYRYWIGGPMEPIWADWP